MISEQPVHTPLMSSEMPPDGGVVAWMINYDTTVNSADLPGDL